MKKTIKYIMPILGFVAICGIALAAIVGIFSHIAGPTLEEKHEKELQKAVDFKGYVNQKILFFEQQLKIRLKHFNNNKETKGLIKEIEKHKKSISHFQNLLKSEISKKNKKGIEYLKSIISSLEKKVSVLQGELKRNRRWATFIIKEKITYYKSLLKEEKPKKTEEE